ncbi:MAG TPA: cbb3-type cytochrome c oxidase subunit I [Calidithermus sp.]|nr:cbb3-type cytochrome c oxidase subunit I [Calidithermus sp.]
MTPDVLAVEAVPARTRRLLTAWLGLSLGSLVAAGLFAVLVALARTPAVQLLGSSPGLFRFALIGHVTFALTVWFIAFAGALWTYAAWRSGYRLAAGPAWTGFALAVAGGALMAGPAFTASGTPYLNDYIPVIDHPLFWAGLLAAVVGVGLHALGYLAAWWRDRAGPTSDEPVEAVALVVAAVALVLALATLVLAWLRLDPGQPEALRFRALVWGAGHLFQFVHTAGMVAVWAVSVAVALGSGALPRMTRPALWALVPFLVAGALAYAVWTPEALLVNRIVTWVTFLGLGGPPLLPLLATGAAVVRTRPRPWSSPLFAGTVLCLALFALGGVFGVIGFRQDTRVPAHYHAMVGAITIAYMGLAPGLLELTGRQPWKPWLTRWQPYLYGLGLLGLIVGLYWAGGRGAPRKTIGFSWADAQALLAMNLMGVGSVVAVLGGLAFVLNLGLPLCSRAGRRGALSEVALARAGGRDEATGLPGAAT